MNDLWIFILIIVVVICLIFLLFPLNCQTLRPEQFTTSRYQNYPYLTYPYGSKYAYCRNCGNKSRGACAACVNCGYSINQFGIGECVPGDASGPYFRQDTLYWEYGNPNYYPLTYASVPLYTNGTRDYDTRYNRRYNRSNNRSNNSSNSTNYRNYNRNYNRSLAGTYNRNTSRNRISRSNSLTRALVSRRNY